MSDIRPRRHACRAAAADRSRGTARARILIGLSAATSPNEPHEKSWVPERRAWSPELKDAIAAVGERSGEAWLHLLGLALELPSPDSRSFVKAVAARVDALELRRHLVGVYVPAWVDMVGADTLAGAAKGNPRATSALLEHPRYYGGRAAEALSGLLDHSAKETKRRLVAALRRFGDEAFTQPEDEVVAVLEAEAESVRTLASTIRATSADLRRHARIPVRARAGVRVGGARPAPRRPATAPPLPAPECACCLLSRFA